MSLASGDLTTTYTVQQYMDSPPSLPIITGLVTRVSRMILSALNRSLIVPTTYTQQFNGTGTTSLVLPNWPVLDLTSLVISGVNITEALQAGSISTTTFSDWGWRFQSWNGIPPGDPAVVELVGANYSYGNQNVVANYIAGYQVTSEPAIIPTDSTYQVIPIQPYGIWATDEGVIDADGVAFVSVTTPPTAGQYIPPDPSLAAPRNYYTFASADAGKEMFLSYGYIPADIEQIAIELITERSTYRKRVGVRSQSLASQEMISYDTVGFTQFIHHALSPYVSVIPPAIGANV